MQTDPDTKPTGVIDAELVRSRGTRVPKEVIDRFLALEDLSGTVSDVLDKMGIRGVVGASILKPTITTAKVVGQAVTVRNVPQDLDPLQSVTTNENRMTEIEGINQGAPGDVLVIQGRPDISNMGGIMATLAKRQGLVGAVVHGGVRDVGQSRRIGFPLWTTDISPITGKWRMETVEVNGVVEICGVQVRPGDLVCGDEAGVAFVPYARAAEVLAIARGIDAGDTKRKTDIERGVSVADLVQKKYK